MATALLETNEQDQSVACPQTSHPTMSSIVAPGIILSQKVHVTSRVLPRLQKGATFGILQPFHDILSDLYQLRSNIISHEAKLLRLFGTLRLQPRTR
jgi:hypothetical protein